ncbi:helix-turn-helix domain-containing protein [Tautonia marina]|uniref:helix-turn-helix domain-containing protein n=1 Tax=Tautonia marina TaxID=2653855 RepID=UPI0012611493
MWTGPKVVAYVRDRWGVAASEPSNWPWLRGLGFSRPRHPEAATPAARRAWKRSPAPPAR